MECVMEHLKLIYHGGHFLGIKLCEIFFKQKQI